MAAHTRVDLDSGPGQHFSVISVEGDSENNALGFHPAGKLLFGRVNREITSHKCRRGKKGLFIIAKSGKLDQHVHSFWFGQGKMFSV